MLLTVSTDFLFWHNLWSEICFKVKVKLNLNFCFSICFSQMAGLRWEGKFAWACQHIIQRRGSHHGAVSSLLKCLFFTEWFLSKRKYILNSSKALRKHCRSVSPFPMQNVTKTLGTFVQYGNSSNYLISYKNYPNEQALVHCLFKIALLPILTQLFNDFLLLWQSGLW